MSHSQRRPGDDQLDAYLDHLLSAEERVAFERRLSAEPGLRDQVQLQGAIDQALARMYSAERGERIALTRRALAPRLRVVGLPRVALAAVCITIIAAGAFQSWRYLRPRVVAPVYVQQPWRSLATVYQDELAGPFKPTWVCRNDRAFAGFVRMRFGEPLLLAQLPSGAKGLGWSYCRSISDRTVYLLGEVDGRRVLVFLDQAASDTGDAARSAGGPNLFRRELGQFVLYEATPFDEPTFLAHFYQPTDAGQSAPPSGGDP